LRNCEAANLQHPHLNHHRTHQCESTNKRAKHKKAPTFLIGAFVSIRTYVLFSY